MSNPSEPAAQFEAYSVPLYPSQEQQAQLLELHRATVVLWNAMYDQRDWERIGKQVGFEELALLWKRTMEAHEEGFSYSLIEHTMPRRKQRSNAEAFLTKQCMAQRKACRAFRQANGWGHLPGNVFDKLALDLDQQWRKQKATRKSLDAPEGFKLRFQGQLRNNIGIRFGPSAVYVKGIGDIRAGMGILPPWADELLWVEGAGSEGQDRVVDFMGEGRTLNGSTPEGLDTDDLGLGEEGLGDGGSREAVLGLSAHASPELQSPLSLLLNSPLLPKATLIPFYIIQYDEQERWRLNLFFKRQTQPTPPLQPGRMLGLDMGFVDLVTWVDPEGRSGSIGNPKVSRWLEEANPEVDIPIRETNRLRRWVIYQSVLQVLNLGDTFVMEDLDLEGLRQDPMRAVALRESGWSLWLRWFPLEAKAAGRKVILVPSPHTSQTCSQCGRTHPGNRQGKQFLCLSCGHAMDADVNAATNILRRGVWRLEGVE